MAEKTNTFVIKDATGKKVGEQTVPENFAPHLMAGQRAELVEPKPKAEAKAAEKPAKAT
jgi:hypothetical protein